MPQDENLALTYAYSLSNLLHFQSFWVLIISLFKNPFADVVPYYLMRCNYLPLNFTDQNIFFQWVFIIYAMVHSASLRKFLYETCLRCIGKISTLWSYLLPNQRNPMKLTNEKMHSDDEIKRRIKAENEFI